VRHSNQSFDIAQASSPCSPLKLQQSWLILWLLPSKNRTRRTQNSALDAYLSAQQMAKSLRAATWRMRRTVDAFARKGRRAPRLLAKECVNLLFVS
jgi:hypothetical protein